jgi:hypothetical protein
MTVSFQNARRVVANTGDVDQITLNFPAELSTDVSVYAGLPGAFKMSLGTHYTVDGVGLGGGITVTIVNPTAWDDYEAFAVYVEYVVDQNSDVDSGGTLGKRFEDALDRQTRVLQSFKDKVDRGLRMPITTAIGQDNTLVPAPGEILGWNEDGTAIVTYSSIAQSTQEAIDAAERAEAAADEIEATRLNTLRTYATESAFLADLTLPLDVSVVKTLGYFSIDDGGGHLKTKMVGAPDPVKPWHKQHANGSWWMLTSKCVNPIMFGAVKGDASYFHTADASDAVEAWCKYINEVHNVGEVLPGAYIITRSMFLQPPFQIKGLGQLVAFETPFFDRISMAVDKGAYFIGKGNAARTLTLDYCSHQRFGGLGRVNPKRLHNNVHDQWLDAFNFTNADAVANKRATKKLFSAMFVIGLNGNSAKREFSNIRVIPACDDGLNGPLAGYFGAQATSYIPWSEWDVGVFDLNAYHSYSENLCCNGYWHAGIGWLYSAIRFGANQSGGRGEAMKLERPDFNGYEIRQPDRMPILSKTANSITVEWHDSHTLAAPGEYGNPATATVYADVSTVVYSSLTFTAGTPSTLTLGGIADTSAITPGETTLCMGNNNGVTQTKLEDARLRGFNHPSGVERPSPFYGAQAGRYQAPMSLIGWPIRGVVSENETFYPNEAVAIVMFGGARDVKIWGGTIETKTYRATGGGPANPDGSPDSMFLCGPEQAKQSQWPMLARGTVEVVSYGLDGSMLLEPIYPSFGKRYSSYKDAFNPCIFDPGKIMGQNGKIYDARKPEQYRSSAVSNGVITAYDEFILVDTPTNGDPTCTIQTLNAPLWINEVTLQRFNSSRTSTLVEGGNINLLGFSLSLFGGMSVTLVRRSGIWYLKNKFETRYTEATLVYDPPSLADGAGADAFVTVPDAALGNLAMASFSINTAGVLLDPQVVNANTVRVRFQNETGGTLDLASGTLRVRVFK